MLSPDPNPTPSPMASIRSWWAAHLPDSWTFTKTWGWQIAAGALVIAFVLAVVRPFASTPEPNAEDIATTWNQSIARLGILPVFPPEEDLHVGDVWAVVADTEETPLLGKAVRIAHIDMRDELKSAIKGQPVFAETSEFNAGKKFRSQDRKEVAQTEPNDGRVALTLAAFPGITISHTTRAAGSLGATLGGLGAGRDDQQLEEIRIPTAETYGISMTSAFLKLDAWCTDAETKIYCTDEFVRRIMAFAVSDRVLATRDEQYISRLQLRLVTRVFLTRETEHRRRQQVANGGGIQLSSDPSRSAQVAGTAGGTDNNGVAAQTNNAIDAVTQATNSAAGSRSPGASVSLLQGTGTEIGLREVFQRPVAFGYRAITVSLPPAKPLKDAPL
jgi:hypothetical protein